MSNQYLRKEKQKELRTVVSQNFWVDSPAALQNLTGSLNERQKQETRQ